MFKVAGILIIVAVLTASGEKCVGALNKRIKSLEAFIRLADALEAKLSSFCIPLPDFFSSYSDPYLDKTGFCRTVAEGMSFSETVRAYENELCLESQDAEILISFGNELGQFSVAEEIKRCRYYKGELEKNLRAAQEKLPVKTKLLRSAGFMCGILAAVLLI